MDLVATVIPGKETSEMTQIIEARTRQRRDESLNRDSHSESPGTDARSSDAKRAESSVAGKTPARIISASSGTRGPESSGETSGSAKVKVFLTPATAAKETVDEAEAHGATSVALVVAESEVESNIDEQVADEASEEASEEPATRRSLGVVAIGKWLRSNVLSSILATALVVAVVLLVLSQLSLGNANSISSERASAMAAAKSYAVDLASYNYKHLNQDFGKVLSESTPTFKQSFGQSSKALDSVLARYNASATASVVAAGIVSVTSSRAVVLVYLNQTVQNKAQKGKPTTGNRLEIALLRSGGRWLIDQVTLL
jgi:Mce-associated membrane protein